MAAIRAAKDLSPDGNDIAHAERLHEGPLLVLSSGKDEHGASGWLNQWVELLPGQLLVYADCPRRCFVPGSPHSSIRYHQVEAPLVSYQF